MKRGKREEEEEYDKGWGRETQKKKTWKRKIEKSKGEEQGGRIL